MLRPEHLSFGRRLAVYRVSRGLTQTAVARQIYCDRATISRYEQEKIRPSAENLQRIAQLFKVPIEELDPNGRPK
jgi:transcriptional regulator with XRE-family HTH domain